MVGIESPISPLSKHERRLSNGIKTRAKNDSMAMEQSLQANKIYC